MSERLTYKTGSGTAHFKVDKVIMNDQIARAAFYQEVCIKLADFEDKYEWISVKDKLPPDSCDVIISFLWGQGVRASWSEIGRYEEDKEEWYSYEDNLRKVTHWMPLPAPPKED